MVRMENLHSVLEVKLMTLVILALGSMSSGLTIKRLERRVRLLEDKVHHDSMAFRDDIDNLFAMVNVSEYNKRAGIDAIDKLTMEHKTNAESVDSGVHDDICVDLNSMRDMRDKWIAVKRGFEAEKEYIHNSIRNMKRENRKRGKNLSDVTNNAMTEVANLMKDVDVDINNLKRTELVLTISVSESAKKGQTNADAIDNLSTKMLKVEREQTALVSKLEEAEKQNKLLLEYIINWARFANSIYYIGTDQLTWAEAKSKCESLGSYLAKVSSVEEQSFIKSLVKSEKQLYYYIGGDDIDREESMPFGFIIQCVYMYNENIYYNECDRKMAYICEKSFKNSFDHSEEYFYYY